MGFSNSPLLKKENSMHNYAMVFPGQGSQSVGMLNDISAQFPEVKQIFARASSVLGYDLWDLCQRGPATELDKTIHTQPALLTAAYAIWEILKNSHLPPPAILAGHSLGEYTALVCANAVSFEDAVQLVKARGQFMQQAVADGMGAMAAIIGLENEIVANICQQAITSADEVLQPANYNSIGQVVIAGHRTAVERAISLAKEQGAKLAVLIPVSVPSHCQLMRPAAEQLTKLLATISFYKPDIPVLNNVDVKLYETAESIRDGLIRQLYKPVRWVETIQYFINHNIETIVECGPGKVLTGLNKRIAKHLTLITTSDHSSLTGLLQLA